MSQKIKDQAVGHALDIFSGSVQAMIIALKASPIVLLVWILFIAPNC